MPMENSLAPFTSVKKVETHQIIEQRALSRIGVAHDYQMIDKVLENLFYLLDDLV